MHLCPHISILTKHTNRKKGVEARTLEPELVALPLDSERLRVRQRVRVDDGPLRVVCADTLQDLFKAWREGERVA